MRGAWLGRARVLAAHAWGTTITHDSGVLRAVVTTDVEMSSNEYDFSESGSDLHRGLLGYLKISKDIRGGDPPRRFNFRHGINGPVSSPIT